MTQLIKSIDSSLIEPRSEKTGLRICKKPVFSRRGSIEGYLLSILRKNQVVSTH